MIKTHYFRKIILLLGDILILYLSFFVTLILRHGSLPSAELVATHQFPISALYFIWLVIFFIAGLYDIEKFLSYGSLRNRILRTMLATGIVSVVLFYLVPFWGITPKTILVINLFIATVLLWIWRKFFFSNIVKSSKINILFFGSSGSIADFAGYLNSHPHLSYYAAAIISEGEECNIEERIKKHSIDIIVVADDIKQDRSLVNMFYKVLPMGVTIVDFSKFYESITGRVPVSVINQSWFLENLVEINKRSYEGIKRFIDLLLAVFVGIFALVVLPFVALIIKLTSPGAVFYKQKRVGKNGKIIEVIKFRTMIENAEKDGAQWSGKGDKRITSIGKFLRASRVDELPQVWNVLRGDLSFLGPRPERPKFVEELSEKLPHYKMRHLIKPGLTGWAQINFPYGASVEDAMQKLQYDLFYIKNRSLALDLAIILKTIKTVLSHEGR